MTYNPTRFCHGLEGAIQSMAMAAFQSAQAERMIDRSGPNAVHLLGRALRRERSISTALAAELQIALDRLAELEGAASATRPRRSANPR